MRALSELTGKDLRWRVNQSLSIPTKGEAHYVLYGADQPVATAHAAWERLKFMYWKMETGEGAHEAEINLLDPKHPAVAWKSGRGDQPASFRLDHEDSFTGNGWITTAKGRSLVWEATHKVGYEYVVFEPGGPRLITVSAVVASAVGGNPGHMLLAPEVTADEDLPVLVLLAFALACEQLMRLHWSAPQSPPSL